MRRGLHLVVRSTRRQFVRRTRFVWCCILQKKALLLRGEVARLILFAYRKKISTLTNRIVSVNVSAYETERSAPLGRCGSSQVDLGFLFSKYRGALYAYIFSFVKEVSLANDLLQDTYLKAMVSMKKSQYIERGRFESWIFRIARNVVMDSFRERKRSVVMDRGDFRNSLTLSYGLPHESLLGLGREVRFLIQRLPKEQREVVILRHYFGMSFQEIARYSEVSINTALGRMRYALINMRKYAVNELPIAV